MDCKACLLLKELKPGYFEREGNEYKKIKVGEGDICWHFMEEMGEECESNAHKVMKYMDENGPLEDYDLSKDDLPNEMLATLQIILEVLKSVGASGLKVDHMKKFKTEEKLKMKHLNRRWQISAFSEKTQKFYYRKYVRLAHVNLLTFKQFKKKLK